MSLDFPGGGSVSTTGFQQLAYPHSFGAWMKPMASLATSCMVSLGDGIVQSNVALVMRPVGAVSALSSTFFEALSDNFRAPTLVRGTGFWFHLLAVHVSATVHYLYMNGKIVAESNGNVAAVPTTTTFFVASHAVANFRNFTGRMEGLTFWNQDLSAADAVKLARGVHPLNVRRSAVTACYPQMGRTPTTAIEDEVGGYDLTTFVGTPTWSADAPPVRYVPPRKFYFPEPANVGDTPPMMSLYHRLRAA